MQRPFLDVVRSLNSRKVKYVVIGGNAAIAHGVARGTFDLDLLIEPTVENASALLEAFVAARLGTALLTTPERVLSMEITVFNDRLPIDVQTRTPGVRFATAWKNRDLREISGVQVPFLSRKDLIRSKRAAGRPVDMQDVEMLIALGRRPR